MSHDSGGHGGHDFHAGGHADITAGPVDHSAVHSGQTGGHADPNSGHYNFSHVGGQHDKGGHGHYNGPADGAAPQRKQLPVFQGVFTTEDAVIVEVPSHSACDIRSKYMELARAKGLIAIDTYWPNLVNSDKRVEKIAGRNSLDDPNDGSMPTGQIPGSPGWTKLWREYWQIGVRKNPLAVWQPLTVWHTSKAFLEVSCVTWCYTAVGDFQTFLVLKVQYLNMWNTVTQRWTDDRKARDLHKAKAQALGHELYQFILRHPPMEISRKMREHNQALLTQQVSAQHTGYETLLHDDPSKAEPLTGDYVDPGKGGGGLPSESEGASIDGSGSIEVGNITPVASTAPAFDAASESGANIANVFDMPDPVTGVSGVGAGDGLLTGAENIQEVVDEGNG